MKSRSLAYSMIINRAHRRAQSTLEACRSDRDRELDALVHNGTLVDDHILYLKSGYHLEMSFYDFLVNELGRDVPAIIKARSSS